MGMKAMKKAAKGKKKSSAMKKRKAMKVSKVGKKFSVFAGNKERTAGGLRKADLTKNKSGKVVSKKRSAAGRKAYKHIASWQKATQAARKALGIKGFCPIGKDR